MALWKWFLGGLGAMAIAGSGDDEEQGGGYDSDYYEDEGGYTSQAPEGMTRDELNQRIFQAFDYFYNIDRSMQFPAIAPGVEGVYCHYPFTLNPGNIDWCLYMCIILYYLAGYPLFDDVQEAYKIAGQTPFLAMVKNNQHPRFRFIPWQQDASNQKRAQPGDIILMRGHGAIVKSTDANKVYTIEGNRGDKMITDYWWRDNRGGRLIGYVRPIAPGKGKFPRQWQNEIDRVASGQSVSNTPMGKAYQAWTQKHAGLRFGGYGGDGYTGDI